MDEAAPTQVVDRGLQGWWRDDDGMYRTLGLDEPYPLERVMSRRAPLRTITDAPPGDLDDAREALIIGGKHAAASTLAAVSMVCSTLETWFAERGAADPRLRVEAAVIAGNPTGTYSPLLIDAIDIGDRVRDTPSKVCPYTRDVLADLLLGWIRSPGPFVEIGGALAQMVSSLADEHGPEGWRHVADQWLDPQVRASSNAAVCYQLLYHRSAYYAPGEVGLTAS